MIKEYIPVIILLSLALILFIYGYTGGVKMTGFQKMVTVCVVAFMLFLCVGCIVTTFTPTISTIPDEETFIVVSEQSINHYLYNVVYHKQTKVMYVMCGGCVTQLNNANGLPLLYKKGE